MQAKWIKLDLGVFLLADTNQEACCQNLGAELPKPVDLIPRTADTLVIYAGSEDQLTWVSPSPTNLLARLSSMNSVKQYCT